MSVNAELATIFDEIAAVLELTGANPFRVGAYERAARVMRDLTFDVAPIAADKKKLTAIAGIGEGTAAKIAEFCQTGQVKEHRELTAQVPPGLLQLTALSGVGPKTTKLLWEKAGVTDLASLKAAIASGSLAGIPRLGEKSIQNIAKSIEFIGKASERTRLGEALPLAESLIHDLSDIDGVTRIEYAGSLRRGAETIGDIDLLAATSRPDVLSEKFASMSMVDQVFARGETKVSVRLSRGIQVDLRLIDESCFGAAWMYFTGSKQHNVALRERAIKMKLRLNEYGLFPDDEAAEGADKPIHKRGLKSIAGRTEDEIYKALGLPFIPPELREDKGELTAALPALIEIGDIKAELHAHTTASDGHLTIDELALEAKRRGFHTIAVTDHSKSSVQANGLSPDRLLAHIEAIREAAQRIKGITILAGAEVDILIDGRLDYDDDLLAQLDVVVASPHASLKQEPKVATARLLAAIRHPLVHILGHPTGRYINKREGLSPDLHALIEAAVEHDTALEINANHLRLDLRDTHARAAVEAGALIAINTDAHSVGDFNELRYGIMTARRGWLSAPSCINTWPKAKLHKWLKEKR